VRVETENPLTGKRKYCCHGKDPIVHSTNFSFRKCARTNIALFVAYLTFVALVPREITLTTTPRYRNETARVPEVIATTAIERQRYEKAEERRQARISQSKHADQQGRREQQKLAELRELMMEWSRTSNIESKSNAEVGPLIPDDDEIDEANGENKDPARLFLPRRKSTLSGAVLPQPQDRIMSESFAEVVETVLPQHANTLQVLFVTDYIPVGKLLVFQLRIPIFGRLRMVAKL
jgi:hypothetical protein